MFSCPLVPSMYTPPPSPYSVSDFLASLPLIIPPDILNVPERNTPPPVTALFPEIVPLSMLNVPEIIEYTPPPFSAVLPEIFTLSLIVTVAIPARIPPP